MSHSPRFKLMQILDRYSTRGLVRASDVPSTNRFLDDIFQKEFLDTIIFLDMLHSDIVSIAYDECGGIEGYSSYF